MFLVCNEMKALYLILFFLVFSLYYLMMADSVSLNEKAYYSCLPYSEDHNEKAADFQHHDSFDEDSIDQYLNVYFIPGIWAYRIDFRSGFHPDPSPHDVWQPPES